MVKELSRSSGVVVVERGAQSKPQLAVTSVRPPLQLRETVCGVVVLPTTPKKRKALMLRLAQLRLAYFQQQLQDSSLARISHLRGLSHLSMTSGTEITDSGISASALVNLRELIVPHCPKLGDATMYYIGQHLNNIRVLNFTMCFALSDSGLEHLVNCPQLETLILVSCSAITDRGMTALAHSSCCQALRLLDVSWCKKVTGAGIDEVSSSLVNLEHLRTCGCAAIDSVRLAHLAQLSQLSHLNLYGCRVLDDTMATCISQLTRLQHLHLSDCRAITDFGIIAGIKPLQGVLQHLSLAGNSRITDKSLAVIGGCSKLLLLDLSQCDKITSVGLNFIKKLRRLRNLDVSSCPLLAESDFLDELKDLQHLDISYCPLLSDECFARIGRQLLQLRQLNAILCSGVTDDGLLSLHHLLDLRFLDIHQCEQVTSEGTARLCSLLPSLSVD